MTLDETLFATLTGLVGGRVYPDIAPEEAVRPYIVYQQIGGPAINFLDIATIPSKKRARYQITIWSDTRAAVAALAISVEDAVRVVTALQPVVEGAPVSLYDEPTRLRGSMQDFTFIF
jgi:hypothetical protein